MKIISELCQNHNGDKSLLQDMIEHAACDSDILKIQSIKADTLTQREEYEDYRSYEDEYKRFKELELSWEDEKFFIDKCKEHGVESMTTIFTPDHAEYFNSLGYDNLKLSGYSLQAFDYGRKLEDFEFKTLYFSTSSLTHGEIKETLNVLKGRRIDFMMMHCICVYPTPLHRANLQNISYWKEHAGNQRVGYSDHSNPYEDDLLTTKLAIFEGAKVIERHFTILPANNTRDGKVSITPDMLAEIRRFSNLTREEQYKELNGFDDQQKFNHKYYKGRFYGKHR